MAAADKIYGTYQQYLQLKDFLAKEKPEALRYLYLECWENEERRTDDKQYAISNFPKEIDIWLMENCKLPFVLEVLADQYGGGSIQAILTELKAEEVKKFDQLKRGLRFVEKRANRRILCTTTETLYSLAEGIHDYLNILLYREDLMEVLEKEEENG